MLCDSCGTTGTGAFCAQCGARLSTGEADPSAVFWADDEPTIAQQQPAPQQQQPAYPEASWDDWLVSRQPSDMSTASGRAPMSPGPAGVPPLGPGLPPSSGGGPRWPLIVAAGAAAALVLALGGGAAWWATTREDPTAAATPSTSTPTTVVTTVTSTAPPPPPTTTVTTTSTTTAPVSAADQLADLRDESLGRLVTDDSWGLSLSAKQDGTLDEYQLTSSGSHVFRLPDILELHEAIDSAYSSTTTTYLLKAEDLGSTQGPDDDKIWMTIVDPGGLPSRDDAQSWCEREFSWLSGDELANTCYPRQLSAP